VPAGFLYPQFTWRYSTIVNLAWEAHPEDTGTVVPIVSKSSFFFLSVAFLGAAVSIQPGGVRPEEVCRAFRYEARANIALLKDDAHAIRSQAERAPSAFQNFWDDLRRGLRTLKADAAADARIAARRFSILVKTS
jgi:hypothetical protein